MVGAKELSATLEEGSVEIEVRGGLKGRSAKYEVTQIVPSRRSDPSMLRFIHLGAHKAGRVRGAQGSHRPNIMESIVVN